MVVSTNHRTCTVSSLTAWSVLISRAFPLFRAALLLTSVVKLTSLSSLQSSVDILRRYRPDYTPRMGFSWPVVEPNVEDISSAKQGDGPGSEPESSEAPNELTARLEREKFPTAHSSKKRQNTALLSYAMRTTAMHTLKSFDLQQSRPPQQSATEPESVVDTPNSSFPSRLSATPAPSFAPGGPSQATVSAPASQDVSVKVRKKKREASQPTPTF